MTLRARLSITVLVAALGCGVGRQSISVASPGAEGGSCYGSGACNAGLACRKNVCVRYTDNRDRTVTDSRTGLVWQQTVDVDVFRTWDDAKTYCADLPLVGGGWRLPARHELQSLVVLGQTPMKPTIDRVAFPNTPDTLLDFFWSSTPYVDAAASVAWAIHFADGKSEYIGHVYAHRVRCVR